MVSHSPDAFRRSLNKKKSVKYTRLPEEQTAAEEEKLNMLPAGEDDPLAAGIGAYRKGQQQQDDK